MPHGGVTPIMTPNPIAAGLPTSGDPILIDISSSITSMGFAAQEKEIFTSIAASREKLAGERTPEDTIKAANEQSAALSRP